MNHPRNPSTDVTPHQSETRPQTIHELRNGSGHASAVQWLSMLGFVTLTSLLLAVVFEWDRYRQVVQWDSVGLSLAEKAMILWLLTAKSMLFFLPLLIPMGLLVRFGRNKTAWALVWIAWICVFSWMAVHMVVMTFVGNHVASYLPFLMDMVRAPDKNYGHWVGGGITYRVLLAPCIVLASGLAAFVAIRCSLARLAKRGSWLVSRAGVVTATTAFVSIVVLVAPALALVSHASVLRRLDTVLPVYLNFLRSGAVNTRAWWAGAWGRDSGIPAVRVAALRLGEPGNRTVGSRIVLHNPTAMHVCLHDWRLEDRHGRCIPLRGTIQAGKELEIPLAESGWQLDEGSRVVLKDPQGWPAHLMSGSGKERTPDRLSLDRAIDQTEVFLREAKEAAREVARFLEVGGPAVHDVDTDAAVSNGRLPNVVILVFESFRNSAVSPQTMQMLDKWSEGGLRLHRHYSGSNCTHKGLFALLYGRTPIMYDRTLDRGIAPQMCETMRRSGYERTFLTSSAYTGFRRMHDFINERFFDTVVTDDKGEANDSSDWPVADRRILDRIRTILTTPQDRPQFVVTLLLSTHCPYVYPAEFRHEQPDGGDDGAKDWTLCTDLELYNRYRNAALFLEHEVMKLIRALDPERNVIIITGDHGESLGEDGFHSHTGPASEIQTRVPFAMVGAGIKPMSIRTATGHCDVLPTLLHHLAGKATPIRHSHGRDLLAEAPPPDEALIAPYVWPNSSRLVLVRGNDRLALSAKIDGDNLVSMRFGHFLDDSGLYKLRPLPPYPANRPARN